MQTPILDLPGGHPAADLIREADVCLRRPVPEVSRAEALLNRAIEGLGETPVSAAERHLLGSAWLNRGNLWGRGDEGATLDLADGCYRQAVRWLAWGNDMRSLGRQLDLAGAWANRGHALLRRGTVERLESALQHFGEADRILRALLSLEGLNPRVILHFGGNRFLHGQTLRALGRPGACEAFQEGIAALTRLENRWDDGHSIVFCQLWLNLGNATWDETRDLESALEAYARVITRVNRAREGRPAEIPRDLRLLSLSAQANRAQLLLENGCDPSAEVAGILTEIGESETSEPVFGEFALLARRARVMWWGKELTERQRTGRTIDEHVSRLSDEIDRGLALGRRWAPVDPPLFIPLWIRFFRLAVELYAAFLPQFLGEVIEDEWPLPEWVETGRASEMELLRWTSAQLAKTRRRLEEREPLVLGAARTDRVLEAIERLRGAENALKIKLEMAKAN